MTILELRIPYNEVRLAAKRDLSTRGNSVECNRGLISDLEAQCVKLLPMFRLCSVERSCVFSARMILLWHSQMWFWKRDPQAPRLPAMMNMIPDVSVILALAESSMLPIRMHFRAKMATRRPMTLRTMPTIIRARTACSMAVGRGAGHKQTDKTTSARLVRLWFNTTEKPQPTNTKLQRGRKPRNCEPWHC